VDQLRKAPFDFSTLLFIYIYIKKGKRIEMSHLLKQERKNEINPETTPVDGYLGSREDEERSETRYVMRIAGTSEPSNLRTHLALPVPREHARPSVVPILLFLSITTLSLSSLF